MAPLSCGEAMPRRLPAVTGQSVPLFRGKFRWNRGLVYVRPELQAQGVFICGIPDGLFAVFNRDGVNLNYFSQGVYLS